MCRVRDSELSSKGQFGRLIDILPNLRPGFIAFDRREVRVQVTLANYSPGP